MRMLGSVAGESLRCVLPVFIALALAIASLIYWLSQEESRWGVMEEAAAYSVAVAEFVDRGEFLALGRGELTDRERERFLAPLVRIMAMKRIGLLWACRPGGIQPLFILGTEGEVTIGNEEVRCQPPDEGGSTRLQANTADAGLVMESFSMILDNEGASLGMIGVTVDAGGLAAQGQADLVRGGWGLGVAFAVGIVCAGVMTLFLNRRLSLLTGMARMAGDGQYGLEAESSFGRIMEICSLGSTFNTVMEILQGHLAKIQRQMLTVELVQDEDDQARVFEAVTAGSGSLLHGETLFIVRDLEANHHNLVVDLFTHQDSAFAILARLAGPARGLEAALSASALRRLLIQILPVRGLAGAHDLARKLFPLADCFLACLEGDNEELLVLRCQEGSHSDIIEKVLLPAGRPQLFHNLGPKLDGQFTMLVEAFPDAEPEALLTGVQGFAADQSAGMSGAVLFVMRQQPAEALKCMRTSPSDIEV